MNFKACQEHKNRAASIAEAALTFIKICLIDEMPYGLK